jgi:predicted metalloprotease with PDZ domain
MGDHPGSMHCNRMGLALAVILIAAPTGAGAQRRAGPDTLRYVFHYDASGSRPVLDVDVDFRGDRTGITRLEIPAEWAGEDSLWKAIVEFDAGPGVTVGPRVDGVRMLGHLPGAHVHLHYVLRQDWTGPLRYPLNHRVVVDSTRVLFNQSNALVFPDRTEGATPVLQFRWTGLPATWRILTSFGQKAMFSGPVALRQFAGASFAAGDFRLVSPGADGGVTIEAQGSWRFTDADFANMVRALWDAETRFWGAPAFDDPFVLLLPIANANALTGTAFTAGFVAAADSTADLTPLGRLLAHELFHLWNGQRLAATHDETRYKWFTEGITDYYADRMFHDLGRYSDSVYRTRVNAVFRAYYGSPALNATRNEVSGRYFTDQQWKAYPYAQGYALALYLEANLPRWSQSSFDLDSLMVATFRSAGGQNIEITDSLLVHLVPVAGRAGFVDAIDRFVNRGAMVPADSSALGPCVTVRSVATFTFDLGFDAAATVRDRVVRGVEPGGPAAQAGVVDGMKLTGYSWNDDASRPVVLQIEGAGGVRVVRYLPDGGHGFVAPQYVTTPGAPGCLTLGS